MSIHGECFDNGMSGKCGWDCNVFIRGDCENTDIEPELEKIDFIVDDSTLEVLEHYSEFENIDDHYKITYIGDSENIIKRIYNINRKEILNSL